MRVISWNIKFGLDIEGALQMLHQARAKAPFELLLLQEMDDAGVEQMATALGLHAAYAPSCQHSQTGRPFGNAVLSATPIISERVLELPHQALVAGEPRIALRCEVESGTGSLAVYSVHSEICLLPLTRRAAQWRTIGHDIATTTPGPVIVGGDFNTVTARGERRLRRTLGGEGLSTMIAESAPTYHGRGVGSVLDHLLARGVTVTNSGTYPLLPCTDHAAIWATFDVSATSG